MKTKRMKTVKTLSLLMALLFIIQLMPLGTALATGSGDKDAVTESLVTVLPEDKSTDGGELLPYEDAIALDAEASDDEAVVTPVKTTVGKLPDEQVKVHSRNYTPLAQASFIIITKGGTTYEPVNGEYEHIPAGAEIEFQIGFHLEDGVAGKEEDPYDYQPGEYFTVTLPAGITFPAGPGDVLTQAGGTKFAEWSIDQATNTLTVTLTNGVKDMGYGKQGVFGFNGSFQYLNGEDDTAEETQIDFGGDIVKITRKPFNEDHPPVSKGAVIKKGNYDAATNKINWTVEVTPPEGGCLDGYTLVDVLTGNHTYTDKDAFKVGSAPKNPVVSTDSKTISYTFSAASGDTNLDKNQIVAYTTTPDADMLGGKSFTNTAHLEKSTEKASNDASVTVSMDGFFDKAAGSAVKDAATGETYVPWTVTVKLPATDGAHILSNAKIIDTIATDTGYAKHEFVNTANYPIKIQLPGQAAVEVKNDPATGSYSVVSGVMTYTFPDDHPKTATTEQEYKLTYYTHVSKWAEDYKDNETVYVKNKADFQWGGSGTPGTGWSFGNVGISKDVVPSGGLLSKSVASASSDYDYQNDVKYIQWSIEIDRNKVDLAVGDGFKILLKDTLPDGLDFVVDAAHKLVLTGGTPTKEYMGAVAEELEITTSGTPSRNSGFTLDLLKATGVEKISKPYIVTFWSKMNDTGRNEFYKASNNSSNGSGSVTFKNKTELVCSVPNLKAEATKTFSSQMVNKSVDSYDYSTRLAKWTIEVNRNQLEIGGATISDTLPTGLKLYIDDTHPFGVAGGTIKSYSAEDAGDSFNIVLPSSTTSTYTITYWTKVQDDALITDGDKAFPNTAKLKLIDNTEFSSSRTLKFKNNVITKSTDYVANSGDTITWSVKINPAQIDLKSASVKDDLSPALGYVAGSAKLYEATVSSSGTLTKKIPQALVTDGFNVAVSGQTVTITLPDGPKAYILEFDTVIIQDTADIINRINFSGNSQMNAGTSTATKIEIKNLYSSGRSGNKSFVIKKVDENGNPMQGVKFTLLNAAKNPFKYTSGKGGVGNAQQTDADGKITFTDLPDWVFYVKEDASTTPNGYIAIPAPIGGVRPSQDLGGTDSGINIKVANVLGEAPVQITKVGAKSEKLSGGIFTLTGKDFSGKDYNITQNATAGTGDVNFGKLPIGEYEIQETKAPDGHVASGDVICVKVDYTDDTKTAVKATYSKVKSGAYTDSYTLQNKPDTTKDYAKLSFKKVDTSGTAIPGVVFVLKGADYADNPVRKTATSQADGSVTFTGLTINKAGQPYKVFETPPSDYLYPNANPLEDGTPILTATVDYNTSKTALVVSVTEGVNAETYYDGTAKTFKNAPALADVKFSKKSSASDTVKINGGTFVIEGTSLGGQAVSITASAIDSVVTFKDVPVGNSYTIKELVPPPGYLLTTETLTNVKVEYTADKTGVVDVDLTTDTANTLKNDPAPHLPGSATISVFKTDGDGAKLPGASFTIYDKDGKALASAISGTDGIAHFVNIPGNEGYTIRENTAPEGYELSTETISVKTGDGTTHSFMMVNKKKAPDTGTIEIHKTNEDGNRLPGASFTLYDKDGNAVATAVSDSSGQVRFKDIPAGDYTIRETAAPSGYILSEQVLSLSLAKGDNRSFTFVNTREEEVPGTVEPTGSIGLLKTKMDGDRLAGAEFSLYNSSGTLIENAVTGADGIARFTKLPYGSYTVRETGAPTGYQLFDGALTVTISAAHPDRSFTLRNVRENEPGIGGWEEEDPPGTSGGNPGGKLPQTGGIPQSLFLLLAGLALLGAGIFTLKGRKSQRKHETLGTKE